MARPLLCEDYSTDDSDDEKMYHRTPAVSTEASTRITLSSMKMASVKELAQSHGIKLTVYNKEKKRSSSKSKGILIGEILELMKKPAPPDRHRRAHK